MTTVWKVPSPLPNSTPTELPIVEPVATSRSRLPSLLKSAIATEAAPNPPKWKLTTGWKVPSPLPNSTPTLPFKHLMTLGRPQFPTRMSGFPSPLTSATATESA